MIKCPGCKRRIKKTGEIRALVDNKRYKISDVFSCPFCCMRFSKK